MLVIACHCLSLLVFACHCLSSFVSQRARTKAEEMVSELQRAFIEILRTTDWLDKPTLAVAIDKVIGWKVDWLIDLLKG
jgi:uncharacterized protein YggT (Ycf19 family)